MTLPRSLWRPRFWLLAGLLLAAAMPARAAAVPGPDREDFADLGTVSIWRPAGAPADLVILLDEGGPAALPQQLASQGHLVAAAPVRQFLDKMAKAECITAVTLLDVFSQHLQQKYQFAQYQKPILIGTGRAAALVYGTLAQAPKGVFRAAVGAGFCPEVQLPAPPCADEGQVRFEQIAAHTYRLQPVRDLIAPWYQLDDGSGICAAQAEPFRNQPAPSPGQGDLAARVETVIGSLQNPHLQDATTVADLPLVELPSKQTSGDFFVVLLSGDGGWANIDQDLGNALQEQGIPVAGWNTLKYFWNRKTPEQAGADLQRVIAHYQKTWKRPRVLVIGFSLGADVLPFMLSHLSAQTQNQIADVALLSLGHTVDFQFHVTNWLASASNDQYTIAPELNKITLPMLCVYGADDDDTLCREVKAANIVSERLPGDHHFNGDYERVLRLILDHMRKHGAPALAGQAPKPSV